MNINEQLELFLSSQKTSIENIDRYKKEKLKIKEDIAKQEQLKKEQVERKEELKNISKQLKDKLHEISTEIQRLQEQKEEIVEN